MDREPHDGLLDWLDRRNAWQFVAILYGARWLVLALFATAAFHAAINLVGWTMTVFS